MNQTMKVDITAAAKAADAEGGLVEFNKAVHGISWTAVATAFPIDNVTVTDSLLSKETFTLKPGDSVEVTSIVDREGKIVSAEFKQHTSFPQENEKVLAAVARHKTPRSNAASGKPVQFHHDTPVVPWSVAAELEEQLAAAKQLIASYQIGCSNRGGEHE